MIDFKAAANVNKGNLGADPRKIKRLSSALQKCRQFGKAWEVGDQGTVFYPFTWWPDETHPAGGTFEMHMSAYFGHRVSDMKALGTTFLRSMSPIDEYGQVIGDGDLAYQFSRIAPLLVTAQKEKELADLNSKDWSVLGNAAYQSARQKIIDDYDTKSNINAKRPLIGRLEVYMLTEVVYVAMDPNSGSPIFDDQRKQKTGTYIQVLSNNRLDKLVSLANDVNMGIKAQNKDLVPEAGKVYFLEVLYNFTSSNNSKSEAGRCDPQGVAPSMTLVTRNPQHKAKLQDWLDRIPDDPNVIATHTYSMAPMGDAVLKSKLQTIMMERASDFQYMSNEDKDRLVKSAKLIDYLRVAPQQDPQLTERIETELGHKIGETPTSEAPTMASIVGKDGSPDFSQQKASVNAELYFGEDDILSSTDADNLLSQA